MHIAIIDLLVFGSFVLTALVVSTIAQASPPRTAPATGFNPQYRPTRKDQTPR